MMYQLVFLVPQHIMLPYLNFIVTKKMYFIIEIEIRKIPNLPTNNL